MKRRAVSMFLFVVANAITSSQCLAQLAAVVQPPVGHPVVLSNSPRSAATWRQATGGWGETLAKQQLLLRGFQDIHMIRTPSDNGIDLIATRNRGTNNLIDLRFVEVKTHRSSRPHLTATRDGPQLSRKWLTTRLKAMRTASDPHVRQLERDIRQFLRQAGRTVDRYCEIHNINTRTGIYSVTSPAAFSVQSTSRIEDVLRNIRNQTSARDVRRWAQASTVNFKRIVGSNMREWIELGGTSTRRIEKMGVRMSTASAAQATSRHSVLKLARVASRLGIAVTAGYESYTIYRQFKRYNHGEIGQRGFAVSTAGSVGGVAGGSAGAVAGAWLGTFGGPVAWATVPAGAIIGGFAGHYAGSTVSAKAADAWYAAIDERVKNGVDRWIVATPYPTLQAGD